MINDNCPLCGSQIYKTLYDLSSPKAHAGVGLPGLIKRCAQCGLIFKSYVITPEVLYGDNYAESFLSTEEYSSKSAFEFFRKFLTISKKRLPVENSKPSLLDVGSGVGLMLEAATSLGYDATGVELSARLAEIAKSKGYTIINKDVSDIEPRLAFDTITMMDIIEHLASPKAIAKALRLKIKPGGELIIYTPNHDSLIVKISHWFYRLGIKAPIENIFACTHTCFFTTQTLKLALEESGYRVIEIRHLNYDISRPGQKVSLIAKLGVTCIEKLGNIFGLEGFRLVMYATPF